MPAMRIETGFSDGAWGKTAAQAQQAEALRELAAARDQQASTAAKNSAAK